MLGLSGNCVDHIRPECAYFTERAWECEKPLKKGLIIPLFSLLPLPWPHPHSFRILQFGTIANFRRKPGAFLGIIKNKHKPSLITNYKSMVEVEVRELLTYTFVFWGGQIRN